MNPEDRLSDLPNCILYHILSFVPTKDAVRTSILSTKWQYIFLGLTNIHIDAPFFLNPGVYQQCFGRDPVSESVVEFVNRRLMLCEATPISEFRLETLRFPEARVFSPWLTTLLSGGTKVLDVEARFPSAEPRQFPPAGVFQSSALEVLRLCGGGIVFRSSEPNLFLNLKVLNLKCVDILCESNTFRFTSETYPLLEEFMLGGCHFPVDSVLEISLHTLRNLAINSYEPSLFKVQIDTPQLQHLKCVFDFRNSIDDVIVHVSICKCESIVSADLKHLSGSDKWCIEVLRNISNVKELHITGGYYRSWKLDTSFPQYPNLTHLEIAGIDGKSVWRILQKASNLESLVYDMDPDMGTLSPPEDIVPLCFAQSLQEIKCMRNFGTDKEFDPFQSARFFLQHGAMLEKMIIEHPSNMEEAQMLMIQDLDRLSPKCEIVFQKEMKNHNARAIGYGYDHFQLAVPGCFTSFG